MNTTAYCVRTMSVLGLMAIVFSAARASDEIIPPPPAPEYEETAVETDATEAVVSEPSSLEPATTSKDVQISTDPLSQKLEKLANQPEDDPIVMRRRIEYSPAPPEWFLNPPAQKRDMTGPVVVKSDPCVTQAEMHQDFQDKLEIATRDYINSYLGSNDAAMLVGYDLNQTRWYMGGPEESYTGRLNSPSVGTMHQQGGIIQFDDAYRQDLEEKWNKVVATARLGRVGLIGFGVLGLIATAFSYFKLDTATRGFYSGRLKFLAFTAVAALLAAGVFAQKFFPWL